MIPFIIWPSLVFWLPLVSHPHRVTYSRMFPTVPSQLTSGSPLPWNAHFSHLCFSAQWNSTLSLIGAPRPPVSAFLLFITTAPLYSPPPKYQQSAGLWSSHRLLWMLSLKTLSHCTVTEMPRLLNQEHLQNTSLCLLWRHASRSFNSVLKMKEKALTR